MTSPYVGPGYSWQDQIAKKIPRQTDILDQTLGQRFGVMNGQPGQQPPRQPTMPGMTAPSAPPVATPGAPPGSTPPPSAAPAYVNPFRPAAPAAPAIVAAPTAQPSTAPQTSPRTPTLPPSTTTTTPAATPPATPPSTTPPNGDLNWMFGSNPDGTPNGPNGGLPIPGMDSSGPRNPANEAAMGLIHQALNASEGGNTDLAAQLNAASASAPQPPGSPAWWAAMNQFANTITTPSTRPPLPQNGATMPPPSAAPETVAAPAIAPTMAGLTVGNPAAGGSPASAPSSTSTNRPEIPYTDLSPFAPGNHTDLGYYVDQQGRAYDLRTGQQLPGSVVDSRNANGPQPTAAPPAEPWWKQDGLPSDPFATPGGSGTPPPTDYVGGTGTVDPRTYGTSGTSGVPQTPPRSPDIPTNPLTTQATGAARDWLNNPNQYSQELITSLWNDKAGQIDAQFRGRNRSLQGDLSRRGITDSTFGGEKQLELLGQERSAQEDALQALMEDAANANSSSRSESIRTSMGLSQQEFNNYLSQWNAKEAAAGADWNRIQDVNASDQQSQLAWQQFMEWMYSQGRA